MSRHLIVVIGSVSHQQYGRIRRQLQTQGLKPKVVRLTLSDLYLRSTDQDPEYIPGIDWDEARICQRSGMGKAELADESAEVSDMPESLVRDWIVADHELPFNQIAAVFYSSADDEPADDVGLTQHLWEDIEAIFGNSGFEVIDVAA